MAIIRKVGRSDLFITMTCNPRWKEIKDVLKNFPIGMSCNDIPNLTTRLFHLKFKSLLHDITKKSIFGKVLAWIYTVEYQKRGLPHVHLVVTLDVKSKLRKPEDIDKYISAEIPDDPKLQKLVKKHMLHGPHRYNSPCIKEEYNNTCIKKFPKQFQENTVFQDNGYPLYRRRNNTSKNYNYYLKNSKESIPVDNSMVVPYNPFLLRKYKCHINVEYCASILSLKYIFDYIHKGGDRAYCKIKKVIEDDNDNENNEEIYDELSKYIDGRYLSPIEAAWRLQELPLCDRSHGIVRLAVHTENQQNIIFEENKEEIALSNCSTTLTEWFELNKHDVEARNIKYSNIPQYYVFINKKWVKRKRNYNNYTIGRIGIVSPKDSERYHLKLILNNIKGATCFQDLRKYNNIIYDTYKEAAYAMELIKDNQQVYNMFEEASSIMFPNQLRKYFVHFLLSENIPGNIIWEKFKIKFGEDFHNNKEFNALKQINSHLLKEGLTCTDFSLPSIKLNLESENIDESIIVQSKKIYEKMYAELNNDQKFIFDEIKNNSKKMYFIDGPGGTGKTYLYKTLIFYYTSLRKKIVSMAWTGIASILLPQGMTSHRTFRLPLNLNDIEIAIFKLESDKRRLRDADVIIWDEASMIPKKALDIVDKTLRDLCDNTYPFGNKLIVLGGDFRQILPVIKNSFRTSIVQNTIKNSPLWPLFNIYNLRKNIRCQDNKFSTLLLLIGEGKLNKFDIPEEWKTNDICTKIYKNISNNDWTTRVILCPYNEDVNKLNKKVLNILDGEIVTYYSIDHATHKGVDQTEEDIHLNYPVEVLNNFREGLPPHKLQLKVNAIVMLIRNLSINDGLCNGTRLKIKSLYKYNIEAEIITGENVGNIVFIPKITLNTGESSTLPFILYRKQFPLVLAFCMTINKSQGQSFDYIGLYVDKPLFSHGQLYVALSRCKNNKNIFIQNDSEFKNEIDNIVWKEVFDL